MKGTAQNRKTVYPPGWAMSVVGDSTTELHKAIACWATQLLLCIGDNAALFSADDWLLLRREFNAFELDAPVPHPGYLLSTHLLRAAMTNEQCKRHKGLAAELEQMDYAHAHAFMAVIRRGIANGGVNWWTKEGFTA